MAMSRPLWFRAFLIITLSLIVSACAEQWRRYGMVDEGGIGGTGITYGRVIVDADLKIGDQRFDAEDAIVTINGQRVDWSALQTGMLATVISETPGDQAFTKAVKITVQSRMVGTIAVVNNAKTSIELLGQTVSLSGNTAMSVQAEDLLIKGELVDVHGFANAEGQITATRIANVSTESPDNVPGGLQLKTRIARTDETQKKLILGSLVVGYTDANVDLNEESALKIGQVATVHGLRLNDEGVLQAANVNISGHELDGVTSDLSMRAGSFEGIIDRIDEDGAVTINGITVSQLASSGADIINTVRPGMLVRLDCRWEENAWFFETVKVL